VNEWSQKRKVMRRYDLTAQLYEMRYAEEQEAKYKAALENMNIAYDSLVLDVGCGVGLLFSHVTAKAQVIVGVDVSKKLLFHAKVRAKNFRNVHLVQADADHLPFRTGSFNVVFAFTVLQNMPKPLETLNEIKRTAKHNASIAVTGLKKAFPKDAFEELLQNAGLSVVSLKDEDALKCYVAISLQNLT
jgi:ubiquinone/menaquinone biosynthesis C-methylase UbiE